MVDYEASNEMKNDTFYAFDKYSFAISKNCQVNLLLLIKLKLSVK